jgi:hypothetical protein
VTRRKASGPPLPTSELVQVPYDGVLTATVDDGPASAALSVYGASGTTVIGPAGVASVAFTVCGQRTLSLRLSAASPGHFGIALQVP